MARFCMFGGQDGQLQPTECVHVTIFGGAEWRRGPAAAHIAEARRRTADSVGGTGYVFITVFGGAEVTWPTLVEEYLALLDAVRTGTLTLGEWDEHLGRRGGDTALRVHAFTLFGAFDGDALPSEDKELDDLSVHQHLGHIPEAAVRVLVPAIGQRGVSRLAAVRHAVALTVQGPRG